MSTNPLRQLAVSDYARQVQRVGIVDTIEEAFAFCFTAVDEEELPAPTVQISPVVTYDWDEDNPPEVGEQPEPRIRFQVSVTGGSEFRAADD